MASHTAGGGSTRQSDAAAGLGITCGDDRRFPVAAGVTATVTPGTTAQLWRYRISNATPDALTINPLFGVAQIAYDAAGRVNYLILDASFVLAKPVTIAAGHAQTFTQQVSFDTRTCDGHQLTSGAHTVYLLVDLGTSGVGNWAIAGSVQLQIDGTRSVVRRN